LSSKDKAISQLEEALTSRQRAIDQLTALATRAASLDVELQQREAKITALERAALEAQSTIGTLRQVIGLVWISCQASWEYAHWLSQHLLLFRGC
jgi:hypothetical protein